MYISADPSIFVLILLALLGILLIVNIVAGFKIFQKAGQEGWKSIIPIYSALVLNDILGMPRSWFFFRLIPGFGYAFRMYQMFKLAEKFNADIFVTIGSVAVPLIFIPIMAFSRRYQFEDTIKQRHNRLRDVINYQKNHGEVTWNREEVILKAQDIHKSYGNLQVLKGIDLEIKRGEILSIVGSSGAGKSTLLHILGTLDIMDKGFLGINDTSVSHLNQKALSQFRNERLGFVFQFHNLLPEFTALENVCIPGYSTGDRSPEAVEERAKDLLDLLGLSDRFHHKPSQLSGGEQQRTSVARALINEPDIVFADEPSGNLDSKNAKELHELLFKLRDHLGQTFVIVTHNKELAEMSDRFVTMKDGVIIS